MTLQSAPGQRKRGRPTVYTQELADEICHRLAAGEMLSEICNNPLMPPASTVRSWAYERKMEEEGAPAFADMYARARSIGLERFADEVIMISDAPCIGPDGYADNGLVQKQRLQAESRKWLLSKLLSRQFGDKVTQELVGDADRPLVTRIELVPVDPRPKAIEHEG